MITADTIRAAIDAGIEETLRDLRGRLLKADRELSDLMAPDPLEYLRLRGKAEGVRLALSYVNEALRAAQPAEEATP